MKYSIYLLGCIFLGIGIGSEPNAWGVTIGMIGVVLATLFSPFSFLNNQGGTK